MWYLCGIGSNIEPEYNIPKAVGLIAELVESVWLSPVVATHPRDIPTDNGFLNALLLLWSPMDPVALKHRFNAIETALGRDRDDPDSKLKDRPIDIDILDSGKAPFGFDRSVEEPYFKDVLEALKGAVSVDAVTLELDGQALGHQPATVYRNTGAGYKIVLDQ